MLLLTSDDTAFPTSDLKWYEPQIVRQRFTYLQPGTPLPNLAAGGGYQTSSSEYFFQCRTRENPVCDTGDVGISILFTTDIYPSEYSMLAFPGQQLEDISLLDTWNYISFTSGYLESETE